VSKKILFSRGGAWAEHLKKLLQLAPANPTEWMEQHTRLLVGDEYSLFGIIRVEDKSCCIRFRRSGSPGESILFASGYGQPMRNFRAAQRLYKRGLALFQPLAYILVPQGVFLLTDCLTSGANLALLWRRESDSEESSRMIQAAGASLATLHNFGYALGDCSWENLYWDSQKVYLIDFDKACLCRKIGSDQGRDLAQFTANAEELSIGLVMYEKFLETYIHAVGKNRRDVIECMTPYLDRYRAKNLARYGPRGQRLV
jgi:tRNA A-37 threonylcarbamoyl transferase component Bud32